MAWIVGSENPNILATNTLSSFTFMRADPSSCRWKRANPIFCLQTRHPFYKQKSLKCWVSGVSLDLSSEKFEFTCIYISQLTFGDPSIHPSVVYHSSVVMAAAAWAGKSRLPSPHPLHLALPEGSQSVLRPDKRHSPSSVSWETPGVLQLVGLALNPSPGRPPGGLLNRCLNHLI